MKFSMSICRTNGGKVKCKYSPPVMTILFNFSWGGDNQDLLFIVRPQSFDLEIWLSYHPPGLSWPSLTLNILMEKSLQYLKEMSDFLKMNQQESVVNNLKLYFEQSYLQVKLTSANKSKSTCQQTVDFILDWLWRFSEQWVLPTYLHIVTQKVCVSSEYYLL